MAQSRAVRAPLDAPIGPDAAARAVLTCRRTPGPERTAARSSARRPTQILILDEATANVDTQTEHRIQDAIARLLQGRTALVIAHRISTIQKADQILVMHHGEIRERGTHDELLERDGLYRRLYEMQYRTEAVVEEAVSG